MTLVKVVRHGSVLTSLGVGATLAGIQVGVTPVPWPLWAVWGALTVVALAQALRDE